MNRIEFILNYLNKVHNDVDIIRSTLNLDNNIDYYIYGKEKFYLSNMFYKIVIGSWVDIYFNENSMVPFESFYIKDKESIIYSICRYKQRKNIIESL